MKKYILGALALSLGFFTSCKNDDIEINQGQAVTLKITPESVISGITEYNTGDINDLGKYSLRIRSLVYDENGDLYSYNVQFADSYSTTVNFSVNLVQGKNYTVFTTTDIVSGLNTSTKQYNLQFWELTDSTKLNTVKVNHAGYIGGQMAILGADCRTITANANTSTVSIAPEMQGALVMTLYKDYTTNHEAQRMALAVKQSPDYLQISDSKIEYNYKSNDFNEISISATQSGPYTDTSGSSYYFGYSYAFLFETTSIPTPSELKVFYQWSSTVSQRKYYYFNLYDKNGQSIDKYSFKKGTEYYFEAAYYGDYLGDGDHYAAAYLMTLQEYYDMMNNSSSSAKRAVMEKNYEMMGIHSDAKPEVNVSLSASNLLK